MEKLNLEILKEVNKFTSFLREKVKTKIKKGVNFEEIINFVEKEIFDSNYLPAFPCQISINEIAAHYTIFDETDLTFKKGDVVNVDFGVSYDGWISDNGFTVEIETTKYKKLIETNSLILNKVCDKIEVGTSMNEIGKMVFDIAKKEGFNTIHNLAGHQIKQNDLHCGISVPNYENKDFKKVEDNMQIAIEPFLTLGDPMIKSTKKSNILQLISTKPVRDIIARKLLKSIEINFPHLPFSKRWLIDDAIKKLNPKMSGFKKR